ncbi:uncharacterized protein LOC122457266 isoform X2 [Dermochelys coriacea]|uniref:uncharacterized protein LOC122457266 isoform X2 n=1 Tax=Dermochelys coriacea TaxID=27794 RepID=UPI001CA8F1BA|nr:uncharacterized protein LOC122457266 isoform X2 [Dermochelys coriacea]
MMHALSFASQQWQDSSCISSGTLPAAEMFLGTISANEGDTVNGRCLIPAGTPVYIVFFCKDGMEISRLQAKRGKFSYDLAYSVAGSSGNISCGYMSRNDNNQVLNSLLSVARYLKVTGASSRSSTTENLLYQGLENDTILTITIPVLVGVILALVLPLMYYLKKKKVVTKRRKERLQSLRERNDNPTEDQYTDNNGVAYCHGMGKEAPEPIYQNFDLEDVPRSTRHSKQKYESAFPLYVNDLYRP